MKILMRRASHSVVPSNRSIASESPVPRNKTRKAGSSPRSPMHKKPLLLFCCLSYFQEWAVSHILAAQLLKFCKCSSSHLRKKGDVADNLRFLPAFSACSPLRFVWF